MPTYLGIDWGGTYVKAGVISPAGKILIKKVINSCDLRQPQGFLSAIKQLVDDFSDYQIKAIGIGAPGIVNVSQGFLYYLPNISGWKNYPLKENLQKKVRLPVFVDNDANMFALAEATLGSAKGLDRAIFLTLGTGLGGAIIQDGKILEGKISACELGHVPISLKGKQCGCGGIGCIETYVGNKHLLSRYHELGGSNQINEVKGLYQAGLNNDPLALQVWQEFSHALGLFLSGMVNVFNPEKIIFGGGVSGAFALFKPMIEQVIKQQAMWPQAKNLKLVKAKLTDPGIIGTGILARERLAAILQRRIRLEMNGKVAKKKP